MYLFGRNVEATQGHCILQALLTSGFEVHISLETLLDGHLENRAFSEVLPISKIKKMGDNTGGKRKEVAVNEYLPI